MATQVVVFSVLLFGTSGVVLDFGRVFSEHSQMQAFTDQAALAAATELDGNSDAIDRAVAAVFGAGGAAVTPKRAAFSEGDGAEFRISHLFFLSQLSDDSGPQYALSGDLSGPNLVYTAFAGGGGAGGDPAAASTQARYVVAVAEERSVRNTLMRLVNAAGGEIVRETNVVRTVAAAKREQIACGNLSNLVICNPWEADPGASFDSVLGDGGSIGLQFRHVADGQMTAGGALTAPNSLARRLALQGPAQVRAICDDPLSLPGASPGMSSDELATARAICMLASAIEEDYCVGSEVEIVAAGPEEITTALSTAFDMWDRPIAGVLEWDRDADGDHSQQVDAGGASVFDPLTAHPLRDMSPLFQPDVDILKGRIWNESLAVANLASGIAPASRLNHPPAAQHDNFNLVLNPCLRLGETGNCATDSTGAIFDYISEPSTYTNVTEYYISAFPLRFFRDFAPPPFDATSFYAAYMIERVEWLHSDEAYVTATGAAVPAGGSTAWTGEDGSLDTHLPPPDEALAQVQQKAPAIDDETGAPFDINEDGSIDANDIEPTYSNYTYNPPYSPIDRDLERRVFNVTVVNCGAARVESEGGVSMTRAPVIGFARMFLLQPPRPLCADGTDDCVNADLVSSAIYSEFTGLSDMRETNYAVLVR